MTTFIGESKLTHKKKILCAFISSSRVLVLLKNTIFSSSGKPRDSASGVSEERGEVHRVHGAEPLPSPKHH